MSCSRKFNFDFKRFMFGVHPCSSFAPSASEDGAFIEGATAREEEARAAEGRCQ